MKVIKLISGLFFTMAAFVANSQIVVDNTTQTPEELVQNVLVGTGVTISNVQFNASTPLAQAVQTQVGYFDASTTTFPITEGLILATGDAQVAVGPNNSGSATNNNGVAPDPNDPDMAQIGSPYTMNNEAILEFDFVPSGDSVVFNYIFASEEYHEYSTSSFNDGFGFIISGPGFAGTFQNGGVNIALVPMTTLPVTMNNLNNGSSNTGPCTNCAYLVDNPPGSADLQFDAHTTVLQAAAQVQCGETYHIKLVIADAGDQAFDSAVFLEASSFSSNGVTVEIASATGSAAITEGCDSAIVTFIRPEDADTTTLDVNYTIGGTATNGTDYPFLSGTVTFPIGEDSVEFYVTPIADAIAEGTETVIISVEIINECGDTVVTEATFEIVDPQPFNILPDDITIDCPTATVDITASPDGGVPAFTYDWGTYGTGTSATVPGNIVGTTSYNVDITDACGVTESGSVDVTLTPAPEPTISFNQSTFTICPSQSANIDATVNNPYSTPVGYSWAPSGQTTEDISVSPSVLTWYYLTIDDGCYQVTDSVKVEIGGVDITNINVTNASDCPGQGPATPGAIQVFPDNPTWTYEIISYVPPQNSGNFSNLAGGINYIVNVTDDLGCSTDTIVFVGLGANPVLANWVADSLRHVTCYGDGDGGAMIDNITGGITTPYDVTWVHTSGLWFTESLPNPGGSSEVDDLFGGQWVVTVSDQEGCAWSYPFEIEEPEELTLNFISNDPTCYQFSDGSVTVNTTGGNGGNIFTIMDSVNNQLNSGNSNAANNLPTGWYYASIVDSEGCFAEDSIFIDQPGQLDIDLNIEQPACFGQETGYAEVDSVYNATGDYTQVSYFWNPNPGNMGGIGANWTNHMGEGTYILTINDENGCSREFSFDIVYPEELVWTEIGYEPAYCRQYYYQSGNGVVFAAAGGGTPNYDYTWTNLQTGQTSNNTTWGGRNPGSYQITVMDDAGCILTQVVELDSVSPIADFDIISDDFYAELEGTAVVCADFENQSQYFANPNNPNADTTFYWYLGYGDLATGNNWYITHDYNEVTDTCFYEEGEFEICLVAINKNGCVDTTCQTIIVHDQPSILPPNVFTPGANGSGDGINDVFTFQGLQKAIVEFECVIVDRWGVVIFEMNDINDSWNGNNPKGKPCADGVYFYTYKAKATNGDEFEGQGNVHLIRE